MAFLIEQPGYFLKKEEYEKEHKQFLLNEEEIKKQAKALAEEYLSNNGLNVTFRFESLNGVEEYGDILFAINYFGEENSTEFDNEIRRRIIDSVCKQINEHYKDWRNDVHTEYKEIEDRFEKVAKKTIKTNILLVTILPLSMIAGILIGAAIF